MVYKSKWFYEKYKFWGNPYPGFKFRSATVFIIKSEKHLHYPGVIISFVDIKAHNMISFKISGFRCLEHLPRSINLNLKVPLTILLNGREGYDCSNRRQLIDL
mgnify:CR=1 FL=1